MQITSHTAVAGGTLYENTTGLYLDSAALGVIRDLSIHDNTTGARISAGTLADSRLFANTTGVLIDGTTLSDVSGNRIYGNTTAIRHIATTGSHRIRNNVLWDHAAEAVRIDAAQRTGGVVQLHNNTFHEPTATAVALVNQSAGVDLRHNIFSIGSGVGLSIDNGSEAKLISDYNLFHVTGGGSTGRWFGVNYPALADWSGQIGIDTGSIAADPRFVDADGADNLLGVSGADHGADDDFTLAADSPGIDRADPAFPVGLEPAPNGSLRNLGADGGRRGQQRAETNCRPSA